jgi:hypothetical protein
LRGDIGGSLQDASLGAPRQDIGQDPGIVTITGQCDRLTGQRLGGSTVPFGDGPLECERAQERGPVAELVFVNHREGFLQYPRGLRLVHSPDPPHP